MKVFPDANFLIAAGLRPGGDTQRILIEIHDEFVTSEHLLSEVARNLQRLERDPEPFIAALRGLMTVMDQFDLLPVGLPLTGAGDRQALAEAIGSKCDSFITSDTDFDALFGQHVKGVLIMKGSAYARQVLLAKPR